MVINTNLQAMIGLEKGRRMGNNLTSSLERLSTGLKVNHGSDDPSGLGIASRMTAQEHGFRAAIQNIQDGISFLQIRDGACETAHQILLRLRDLAVRASNQATLTDDDRVKLSAEGSELVAELTRMNLATKFNSRRVFELTFESVPAGNGSSLWQPGQIITGIDLKSLADANGGVVTVTGTWYDGASAFPDINLISPDGTEAFGYMFGARQDTQTYESYVSGGGGQTVNNGDGADNAGMDAIPGGAVMTSATSVDYDGWGAANFESFTITNPVAGMWTIVIDNENSDPHKYGVFLNEPSRLPEDLDDLQIGANSGDKNKIEIPIYQISAANLGAGGSFSSIIAARSAITSISNAIDTLSSRRAEDGALMRRLESVLNDNMTSIINLKSAISRITDTDFAEQAAAFTREQIITSSAQAAVAQANTVPNAVLSLMDTSLM